MHAMELTESQRNTLLAIQAGTYNAAHGSAKGRATRLANLGLIENLNGLVPWMLTDKGTAALRARL